MAKWTRARRLREVELRLREHGWSGPWLPDLATEAGVSLKTIRRDRDVVLRYLRDEELGSREERRTRFLLSLRADRAQARADRKWAPVATLATLESKVIGLDVPPPEPQAEVTEDTETDPLRRLLTETRAMRLDAQARGSMVAAARLLEREHTILTDIAEEDRRKAEAETQAATDDEVLGQFSAALQDMPESMVEALGRAIKARLGE